MTRSIRLLSVFEIVTVLLYAIFLWGPGLWSPSNRGVAGPVTLLWLALPGMLARHGASLQSATMIVTISAIVLAAAAALLSIAARMRASSALLACAAWLFGISVAILMPLWTAVGFLGALLLVLALRARFVPLPHSSGIAAVLSELWPASYAIGFAVLAWHYNPQLLLKTLVIAFGISLVARALVPPHTAVTRA